MKILIGIKRKNIGDGFRDRDFADEVTILAKGELEVLELTNKIKKIRKALAKEPVPSFRYNDTQLALHKKYGIETCKLVYDHKILMVTEADLL